jgi:hypothetical protein
MPHTADVDMTGSEIRKLASSDAIAAFLTQLGYPTACRKEESPAAYGLATDSGITLS